MKHHSNDKRARAASRSGLSLLEVMLAVTIFSLVMLSMFALLNTSTRTLERSTRAIDNMLRSRGVFDTLATDFRSFYYENESDYNENVRRTLQQLEAEQSVDSNSNDNNGRGSARDRDNPLDRDEDEDDFLLPIEIDLSFVGTDGEDQDEISFVAYKPNDPGGFNIAWGARRVQYFVRDNTLYRAEDTIFKEHVHADGTVEAKPEPVLEKVSDHVAIFDLKYRYWKNGEWLLAPSWDSAGQTYRFPGPDGTAEELGISDEEYQRLRDLELPDDAPAMVQVTLGVQDPNRPRRVEKYLQTFRLYQAQETAYDVDYQNERRGSSRRSGGSSSESNNARGRRR